MSFDNLDTDDVSSDIEEGGTPEEASNGHSDRSGCLRAIVA
jgi:hypothetical protein